MGLFSALVYRALAKRDKTNLLAMGASALTGSLTNTICFLGLTYFLAADLIATAFGTTAAGVAKLLFATTGLINGGIEAAVAVIICTAIGKALHAYMNRTNIWN